MELRRPILLVAFATQLALSGLAAADDALATAPSRFAMLDGIKVHYKVLGQGSETLVLVHGWTCDLRFWRLQAASLARTRRVILVDLPGHGGSEKPEVPYTMDLFARAVESALRAAGASKAVLAGHSMGAAVVLQFHRLFADKTLAIVTVDGALRPFVSKPAQIEAFVGRYQGPDYKEKIAAFAEAMFPPGSPAEVVDEVKTVMTLAPQHVVVGAARGMLDPAFWTDVRIGVPLGAVMTDWEGWKGYEDYLKTIASTVEYRTVPAAGHFLMLQKPAEFLAALESVLGALTK